MVSKIVQAVSSNRQSENLQIAEPYRIWIDPLLCPVEREMDGIFLSDMKEGKKVSLQKTIYILQIQTLALIRCAPGP